MALMSTLGTYRTGPFWKSVCSNVSQYRRHKGKQEEEPKDTVAVRLDVST